MGIFDRNKEKPASGGQPAADLMARAQQMQAQAMQQAAALQQALAGQQAHAGQQAAPAAGSMTWARQVLAILAPPQPGFVKRCSCVVCGAPKQLPAVTAYVYCDFCASLIDFDLRRASEGDTVPGPEYAATVNGAYGPMQAAVAAGDRDAYGSLQRRVFEAYVTHVPMAVSHRARNDAGYRRAYVDYMAQAAVARAFDPAAQALEAEMRQRVMGLRYSGNMMSPTVEPESFWPMVGTLEKQIEISKALYRSCGLAALDPDHAEHLTGKFAWSGFCQGWLGMLPSPTASELLDRAGLKNEYVPVRVRGGQPRHCGGCGGEFRALPGASAVICDGCGRKVDLGSAEIPCARCGGSITLPAGADSIACPYCQTEIRKAGIR